jgi:hypothetical protein
MLEFIVGLILGSVLGVVADRLWGRFENRPRLQLTNSYFENWNNENGIRYKVRNVGLSEVPDFEIVLWHPLRGSIIAFHSTKNGPLLPDQSRDYQCVLIKNGVPIPFLKHWILHEKDQCVSNFVFEQFKLLVRMQNSNRVLFESTKIGNAVAKDWYRSLVLNKPGSATWADNQAMCSSPPLRLKYWLERRREKKELKKLLAQHKKSNGH